MSSANLLKQAQRLLQGQFPAKLKIANQCYEAATSGLKRGLDLAEGPGKPNREIAFWLPACAFTAAGKPVPREETNILSDFGALAGSDPSKWITYRIKNVSLDGSGATVILTCEARAQ